MADLPFPKAQACLLLLAALLFGTAVATLGLTANSLLYYNRLTDVDWAYVDISWIGTYNATTETAQRTVPKLLYRPIGGLDLGDQYALLVTGIFGTLLGLPILIGTLRAGAYTVNMSLTGRTVRPVHLLGSAITFIFEAILLITFVATTGYAWSAQTKSPRYLNLGFVNDPATGAHTFYNGDEPWTFERWNCALAFDATYDTYDPSKKQLRGMCRKAFVARALSMVLFVLVVCRMGLHYWAWRRHNVAVRLARTRADGDGGVGGKGTSFQSSSEESRHEKGEGGPSEMPGQRLSRSEAPDAVVEEMPGDDDGSKEMQAGLPAVELDASPRTVKDEKT